MKAGSGKLDLQPKGGNDARWHTHCNMARQTTQDCKQLRRDAIGHRFARLNDPHCNMARPRALIQLVPDNSDGIHGRPAISFDAWIQERFSIHRRCSKPTAPSRKEEDFSISSQYDYLYGKITVVKPTCIVISYEYHSYISISTAMMVLC